MQTYHHLYVPGNKLEFVNKAIEKGAQNVIIDLEDSIPLGEKDAVREDVCRFLSNNKFELNISVRINSNNDFQQKDIQLLIDTGIENIFVPKLDIDSLIVKNNLGNNFKIIIGIIETATGLNNIQKIAEKISLERLAIGEVDFSADLGIEESQESLLFYRSKLVFASKSLGLKKPIGGVFKNLNDVSGLERFAFNIKNLGFGGMQAIHPGQLATINKIFKPSDQEISEAKELLKEIRENDSNGIGVFVDGNGSIVDAAMVKKAQDIIYYSE